MTWLVCGNRWKGRNRHNPNQPHSRRTRRRFHTINLIICIFQTVWPDIDTNRAGLWSKCIFEKKWLFSFILMFNYLLSITCPAIVWHNIKIVLRKGFALYDRWAHNRWAPVVTPTIPISDKNSVKMIVVKYVFVKRTATPYNPRMFRWM